ncbi:MAG: triphosphoribosyl-dephospho-CoA synthase [Planctomycetales bacterium]|nr:triphosphoribosyl-dephospho-CoA synthase [Planctomycetales bacterium]
MTSDNLLLPSPLDRVWPIPQAAALAILLEATSFKVGNVHPTAGFRDMHLEHFLVAGTSLQDVLKSVGPHSQVGAVVLECVQRCQQDVGTNTSLGTIILLAPLAIAKVRSSRRPLRASLADLLRNLTPQDARNIYLAIVESQAGGLGKQPKMDLREPAPDDLLDAMRAVANTDAVARQYVNDFEDIFERLLPWLLAETSRGFSTRQAIARTQIRWLAYEPDGLIVRKTGADVASQVQQLAQAASLELDETPTTYTASNVVQQSLPLQSTTLLELDSFLRRDGNRCNPGTTADLLAATVFTRLICGEIS